MTNNQASDILQDAFSLGAKVALYVPSTYNGNETCPDSLRVEILDTVQSSFAQMFGGATAHEATGLWQSEELGLVSEAVTIVESFALDSDIDKCLARVVELAQDVKSQLQQEAVSLELRGRLFFI